MDWTGLENRLAQAIGLESSALGSTVFRQCVVRRMRAREADALPEYMKLLDSDSSEFQALVEELVVPESWFFRHAHAFEVLRRHATTTMVERQNPYRVLSFPCAGGEEPYSIVVSLREAGLGFHQFRVDAADISEMALQTAQRGKYGRRSIRVVTPEVMSRYFRMADQSVEVLPEIREAVRFTQANIIAGHSVLQGDIFDAVFCRNLLIYLTPAARQRVIQEVAQWLSPGGLLFVGHAEMLRELEGHFKPIEERGAFAYCRQPKTAVVQPGPLRANTTKPRPDVQDVPLARPLPPMSSSKGRSDDLVPTTARSDRLPTQRAAGLKSHGGPTPTLQEAMREELAQQVSALASAARYPDAIEVCEQQLRKHGPSSQLYHLLGMVLQGAGLYDRARQALERVVYLDPHHEEALLGLALLARRRGDVQTAERFEQRCQRVHDRGKRT